MDPRAHTEKVIAKATRKRSEDKFRCDNCGKTFVSEGERQAHEKSEHSKPKTKRAG